MVEKLFVYGSLCPDCPNEHVLDDIGGSWEIANVSGALQEKGWGAKIGYPGIKLDKYGESVKGFLFTSKNLSNHWTDLDAFEGEAYHRVLTEVKLKDGEKTNAYIYTLRQS